MNRLLTAACIAAGFAAAGTAFPQTWPSQRVTLVVPLAPGGAIDIVARAVAPLLEQKWKQPVIVENRTGGGLMVATNYVAKAPGDGYTLLVTGNGLPMTRLFVRNVEYADSDLKPVVELVRGSWLVVTNADTPAKTLQEFITHAKARPGAMNFGTIANTTFDLDYVNFAQKAGIQMTAIPYPGTPAAVTALARNDIQFFFGVPSTVAPLLQQGRLTVLAQTPARRAELQPNVPTIRELGIDFDTGYSFGIFAPGRTPDAAVALIAADVATAVKTPAVSGRFRELGFESSGLGTQPWAEELQKNLVTYTELAQKLGIKPQ